MKERIHGSISGFLLRFPRLRCTAGTLCAAVSLAALAPGCETDRPTKPVQNVARDDGWVALEVDQALSEFRAVEALGPGELVWNPIDETTLVGRNVTNELAQIEIGQPDWQQYEVEFEVRALSNVPALSIGITSEERPTTRAFAYYDISLSEAAGSPGDEFEDSPSGWIPLRIVVTTTRVRIVVPTTNSTKLDVERHFPLGGVAIRLSPRQSIAVRNVRVRTESKGFAPGWSDVVDQSGSDEAAGHD